MNVKRWVSWFALLALLFAPSSHSVFSYSPFRLSPKSQVQERIEPTFLQNVKASNSLIPILIELRDLPGIEYWVNHQAKPFATTSTPKTDLLEFIPPYQDILLSKQSKVLDWARRKSLSVIPLSHLTLTLNAITAEVRGEDLEALSACPLIEKIHDNRQMVEPIRVVAAKTSGTALAWDGLRDASLPPLSGKNKVIGVMDSGVDTSHPEFSMNGKILGGYNLADGDENIVDDSGHGTMVAGIACGQGTKDEKQGRGIAYDAGIRVYKIFSRKSPTADLLVALEKVVKDGCDVLNCSFGGSSSDFSTGETSFHRAFRNADKAGILVVAGAGNSGSRRKEVPWPILSPSIIDTVFSVGGSDDRKEMPYLTVQVPGKSDRFCPAIQTPDTVPLNTTILKQGVINCGYGTKEELSKVDLSKKVALIQRGPNKESITYREKLENARDAGASGVIFYNYVPHQNVTISILKSGENKGAVGDLPPSISLSKEDGEAIKIALTPETTFYLENRSYSTIANFSSMGLSGDSVLKPEITAPSTQVHTTALGGKYGSSSGTSFSTPMISGMVALLKEGQPTWSHQQIKSALMNTADIMINPVNQLPISFILQGAGTARMDRALTTPAFLEPRSLVLSRTPTESTHTFLVSSARDEELVLPLSAEFFHLSHETVPLTLSFDKSEIRLAKGEQATFTVTIKKTEVMLQNRYEGIIKVGDKLHIPLLCFRDPAQNVEESITNIQLSSEILDLGPQNSLKSHPVQISFSLNAGTITSRVTKDYTAYTSYNYGNVDVWVADDSGELWGKIFTFSNIMVGEYTFLWDGTNVNNELFLPKGSYQLYFTIPVTEQKDKESITKLYGPFTKAFQVSRSSFPELITGNLSTVKMIHGNDTLHLGLRLNHLPKYLLQEGDITKIEFLLYYEGSQPVLFQGAKLIGFLEEKDLATISINIEIEGVLKVTISSPGIALSKINELPFLEFEYKVGAKGDASFFTRSFQIVTASHKNHRVKAYEVGCRISSRDFLLCDINKDKFTDQNDADLFMECFGTRAEEEYFDEKCDFNQDRRIDAFDLILLGAEME